MRDHIDIAAPRLAYEACVDQIRQAGTRHSRLRIRGGASKSALASSVACGTGESLDTRALSGIGSYEPSELVVTALGGTPLAELEQVLAEQGQCLPFEPPHVAPGATVGGMVAAGLAGPARASSGSVRDHVLGVAVIDGQGRLLRFGGQVMKNVAGYDVSRLMAGSWGRLGVIAQVSLKVLPAAPAEATLRFEFDEATALQTLARWNAQPLPINASCWVLDDGRPSLFVRLRGAQAAVAAACRTLGGEAIEQVQALADWQACRDLQLPWFRERPADQCLWQLSVPPTAPALGLPHAPLIEWHGARRWVQAPADAADKLRQAARAVGGFASLFIADQGQSALATSQNDAQTPVTAAIEQRLHQVFDPQGVFSPAASPAVQA